MGLFSGNKQSKKIKQHIKQINPKFSFTSVGPAIKVVPNYVDDDEKYIYATSGDLKGVCLVLVTDKRVLILQRDPLGANEHVVNIRLNNISDVSYREGRIFSKFFITDDEQMYMIKQITNEDAAALVKAIKQTIRNVTHKELSEELHCPYCGSENVKPLGVDKKNFSVGKAAAGAVLTGSIGVLAGFAGKKTGMTDFVCMDCGKQFKK